MPENIHGKQYNTVAERVNAALKDHNDWTIETQCIDRSGTKDGDVVCMKALIFGPGCSECGTKELIATGYAEEVRGQGNINKTDPLENCETGAVGRALAFAGYPGTDIATTEEQADARLQKLEKDMWAAWAAHTECVERNRPSLIVVRDALGDAYAAGKAEDPESQAESTKNYDIARETWNELSHDDQMILWRATTKGGWFTPLERQQMKYWSNDFEKTRHG